MDDAVIVGVLESLGELNAEMGRLAPGEPAAGLQFVFDVRPLDQFHYVIQIAGLFAEAVEPDDVRMLELLERLDLGLESLTKALLDGEPRAQDLDRGRLPAFDVCA